MFLYVSQRRVGRAAKRLGGAKCGKKIGRVLQLLQLLQLSFTLSCIPAAAYRVRGSEAKYRAAMIAVQKSFTSGGAESDFLVGGSTDRRRRLLMQPVELC